MILFYINSVTPETLFPGCMAHTGDPLANDLIETLLMQMPKVCTKAYL